MKHYKVLNSDQKRSLAKNNLDQFHDAPCFEPSVNVSQLQGDKTDKWH